SGFFCAITDMVGPPTYPAPIHVMFFIGFIFICLFANSRICLFAYLRICLSANLLICESAYPRISLLSYFIYLFFGHYFPKPATRKTMVSFVVIQLNSLFFTIGPPRKILILIFFSNNSHVYFKRAQDIFQVLLRSIRHYFINMLAGLKLNISLHYGLCGLVFLRSIYSGVCL